MSWGMLATDVAELAVLPNALLPDAIAYERPPTKCARACDVCIEPQ